MINSRFPLGALFWVVCAAVAILLLGALGGPGVTKASSSNRTDSRLPPKDGRYFHYTLDTARNRDEADTYNRNTSMALYKEPNGWMLNVLKELFSDIDWQAIDNARVQIEKFIQKVDRIVGSFRSIISKATSGGGGAGSSSSSGDSRDGRWWGSGDKTTGTQKTDTTNVKEMLERVACYVGYVRLMNLSNEALAELDASKAVSNLFRPGGKGSSGMWSWLG